MVRLIEPLIPALRRYARALMRERAAADDLVQDCLERAISRWHQRRHENDARAWIFTILHNLAMTRLRRAAQRPVHVALDDVDAAHLSHAASQEDGLRHRDLLAALAQLPDEQRTVLLLVTVEQLSYAETAQVLEVPIGTVMSRLSRARERLVRLMSAEPRAALSPPYLRSVK
ncbi:MAG: RNA polymerase subunit sigma [Rhizobiales bacterium 24-66-13]|uniref:RNA polymerase sigma factor n=1 Tax=Roseixanthobacter finlandensis TaxID=3119922 RepID=UPI000BD4E2F4|nr:MAG: RNA polymerase subunit sigma [Rhizobiales bacterium 35-66-30]OYZ75202.1 MAG: RNA polymerase subunit sigma [Rhizobiales bacterium 24-66-13]OZB06144.1 MAG: RNA polymerase subunit sigma [Rhizobiales bacterium 39-66-18]HQS09340.1 sigma-70 family RNA polymerase sigma factor [Xanthobacteraceae bacterium]